MFGFFKKKASLKTEDRVYMTKEEKYFMIHKHLSESPGTAGLCWFQETKDEMLKTFPDLEHRIVLVQKVPQSIAAYPSVVFCEHHPMFSKEESLCTAANITAIEVYSALDEAFFDLFGGARIRSLLLQLGHAQFEPMSHSMINASIRKAQDKIDKQVQFEVDAYSQKQWLDNNCRK